MLEIRHLIVSTTYQTWVAISFKFLIYIFGGSGSEFIIVSDNFESITHDSYNSFKYNLYDNVSAVQYTFLDDWYLYLCVSKSEDENVEGGENCLQF